MYEKDLALLDVVDIKFLEISSKLNYEEIEGTTDLSSKIDAKIANNVSMELDGDSKSFAGIDTYWVKGTVADKDIIEIKIQIAVICKSSKTLSEHFFEIFEKHSLKHFTYPYLRQIIQDLTMKMGFPPLVLPLWRRPKKSRKKSETGRLPKKNKAGSKKL